LKAARVICTDPHVTSDADLVPLDMVLNEADLVIVATPHREYVDVHTSVPIIDLFNLLSEGVSV
jgi:UDP-N-acetyl-D-mannosaminuronic acid dehydrogenase